MMSVIQRKSRGRKVAVPAESAMYSKGLKEEADLEVKPRRGRVNGGTSPYEIRRPYCSMGKRNDRGSKIDKGAAAKREEHLRKNREIAKECRERKNLRHSYLESLKDNVEWKNIALRKELKLLKMWAGEIDKGIIPDDFMEYRLKWDSDYQTRRAQIAAASYTQLDMTEEVEIENIEEETEQIASEYTLEDDDNNGSETCDANSLCQTNDDCCCYFYLLTDDDSSDEDTGVVVSPVDILPNFDSNV